VKRLAGAKELLDGELDPDLLRGNLDDLARVNRWLGGTVLSRRAVVALLARRADRRAPASLLDVGTGAGDLPAAMIGWFGARGVGLCATAGDTRAAIVEEARKRTKGVDGLTVELVPEEALPYDDDAFDVAHVSMVLHHLETPEAIAMLSELARVSRLGVVVNDLDRTVRFWLGAIALSRITTRNDYTRTDGPMSVQRGWRVPEVEEMAAMIGLRPVARFTHPFGYRYAIAFERDRDG
jgi:2-polyprenyl-3-methyl-5-hydroxy-6-metoxy-1,4-benzoquinol methylase